MQLMDVMDYEVKDILSFLCEQLMNNNEHFIPQAIANSIFSLQNKNSDHKVIRDLLQALSHKVKNMTEPLCLNSFLSAM
jgi:hypothetical protein